MPGNDRGSPEDTAVKNLDIREVDDEFPRGEGWVAASWIGSALYCEHGLYLEKVEDIEAEVTEAMRTGTAEHERRHGEFQSRAEETDLSLREASEEAVEEEEVVQFSEVPLRHDGHRVYGKADRVKVFPGRMEALDFKNVAGGKVYASQRFQALSYALMLEDTLGLDLSTYAVVLDRETGEEAWREPLDPRRRDVLDCIDRVRGVLLGDRRPEPTTNGNKCRKCTLLDSCGVSAL